MYDLDAVFPVHHGGVFPTPMMICCQNEFNLHATKLCDRNCLNSECREGKEVRCGEVRYFARQKTE
jgi:hypothetical protein